MELSSEQLERYTLLLMMLGVVIVLLGGVFLMLILPRVFRFLRPGPPSWSRKGSQVADPWHEAARRMKPDAGDAEGAGGAGGAGGDDGNAGPLHDTGPGDLPSDPKR